MDNLVVAQTIELPNIRKMFVPDPGYEIAEADLSGADAQVVAWEANDLDLMAAFRKGLKLHLRNAKDLFPERTKGLSDDAIKAQNYPGGIYYDCKRAVHLTNYGGAPRAIAVALKWTMVDSERFQKNWFGLHPGIKTWQDRTNDQLLGLYTWPDGVQRSRTIYNKFGYRIVYFDRVKALLPKALAWIPQSTVAITTIKGGIKLQRIPWVEILLQVHDSLVFQYPIRYSTSAYLAEIKQALTTEVPYPDPLTIPWELKTSRISWGDCQDRDW